MIRKTNFEDIVELYQKFGLDADRQAVPSFLSDDLQRYRLSHLVEELGEYAEAVGSLEIADHLYQISRKCRDCNIVKPYGMRSLPEAADSLVDLSVLTLGTAYLHSFPWQACWAEVQRANLAKERAAPDGSNSKRGSKHDIIKPSDWTPPNIEKVLENSRGK